MRITPDTNILVRAVVTDEPQQSAAAMRLLREAEIIVLTLPALCELVWVLRSGYRNRTAAIAQVIRDFVVAATTVSELPAVEAGLAMLDAGGDFADGVIAYEGRRLGGEVFASFDRRAVRLIAEGGGKTHLLAGADR